MSHVIQCPGCGEDVVLRRRSPSGEERMCARCQKAAGRARAASAPARKPPLPTMIPTFDGMGFCTGYREPRSTIEELDFLCDELNEPNFRGYLVRVPGSKFCREPVRRPGEARELPPSEGELQQLLLDSRILLRVKKNR